MQTYDTSSDFKGTVGKWDVDVYASKIKTVVINESKDGMTLEFDLINVEAPFANALRRVLIAEVANTYVAQASNNKYIRSIIK